MPRIPVYVLHPPQDLHPCFARWIDDARGIVAGRLGPGNCDVVPMSYRRDCGFDARSVFSRVQSDPGPVIICGKAQKRPCAILRNRLLFVVSCIDVDPASAQELADRIVEARDGHGTRKPLIPRKLAVALCIMRKLERRHAWGGSNKGYEWSYNIPKGRGVDEQFADVVPEVVNDLKNKGILIDKRSRGYRKYALNPDRRTEIYGMLERHTFEDESLLRVLTRDKRRVSARVLD